MPVTFAETPVHALRNVEPHDTRSCEAKEQRMMRVHSALVHAVKEQNPDIDPFAKECQARLAALGGWEGNGVTFTEELEVKKTRSLALPDSNGQYPVTVLDGVLSKELCQSFIKVNEMVGFSTPPSLISHFASKLEQEHGMHDNEVNEQFKKYSYEHSKNTSEAVQIESLDFSNYLWERVQQFLPNQQAFMGKFTSGIYERCGIIPVFRFMKYSPGQGFKPHRDPHRIFAEYPLASSENAEHGDPGIYESLFTIALYLNDPSEFKGGKLNFVKLHVNEHGCKTFESQATVDPAVGRCVLFRHDDLHEGGGVEVGTKYMCQCDVLYKRVGDL